MPNAGIRVAASTDIPVSFTIFVSIIQFHMRIVILADPLDNQQAGIHHYTRNLVEHLAQIDIRGEYYLVRRKRDGLFPAGRQIIIRNYRIPGYAALRMFLIIPMRLMRMKADVVVEPAHFGPFNLPRRIKRVTVIHDLTPVMFPRMHRIHSQLLQRMFLKGIIRRATLLITNSDNTSNDVIRYCPGAAHKLKRIYLGRDEGVTFNEDRSTLLRYAIEKPYFFFTGTIEPRKNLVKLLDAYTLFRENTGLSHLLVIAGSRGWKSRQFFRKLAKHPYADDIRLCGYVDRKALSSLYSHAVALVYPSHYEGFGLPVIEAMNCGTPCLLSNTSSLPEVGGEAARYFDPNDIISIAESMERIVKDDELRDECSARAKLQAARFSWSHHVRAFDEAIKNL